MGLVSMFFNLTERLSVIEHSIYFSVSVQARDPAVFAPVAVPPNRTGEVGRRRAIAANDEAANEGGTISCYRLATP